MRQIAHRTVRNVVNRNAVVALRAALLSPKMLDANPVDSNEFDAPNDRDRQTWAHRTVMRVPWTGTNRSARGSNMLVDEATTRVALKLEDPIEFHARGVVQ